MEGRDERRPESLDELQHVPAVRTAVDAVLVLERQDVGPRAVDRDGRAAVVGDVVVADRRPDLGRLELRRVQPVVVSAEREDRAAGADGRPKVAA